MSSHNIILGLNFKSNISSVVSTIRSSVRAAEGSILEARRNINSLRDAGLKTGAARKHLRDLRLETDFKRHALKLTREQLQAEQRAARVRESSLRSIKRIEDKVQRDRLRAIDMREARELKLWKHKQMLAAREARAASSAVTGSGGGLSIGKMSSMMGQAMMAVFAVKMAFDAVVGTVSRLLSITRGFIDLAKSAAEIQQERSVRDITLVDGSAANSARLNNIADEVASGTQFLPDDIARMQTGLARMGKSTQEIATLSPVIANFAQAHRMSVEDASKAVAGMANSLKVNANGAGELADKMSMISTLTNVAGKDIARMAPNIGRLAASMTLDPGDTLLAIGFSRDLMARPEMAARSFTTAMSRAMSDNKNVLEGLNALRDSNGDALQITDKAGNARELLDIFLDINKAFENNPLFQSEQERNNVLNKIFGKFGILAGGGINAAIERFGGGAEGRAAIQAMRDQIDGSAGTTAKIAEAMMNNLNSQIQLLIGKVALLAQKFGAPLERAFTALMRILNPVLEAFVGLAAIMPRWAILITAAIPIVLSLGAALGLVAATAAILVAVIVSFLITGMAPLAIAIGVVSVAVSGFIVFIGLLAESVNRAFGGNIGFTGFVNGLKAVALGFKTVFQALTSEDGSFDGAIKRAMDELVGVGNADKIIGAMMRVFTVLDTIRDGFNAMFDGIIQGLGGKEGMKEIMQSLVDSFSALGKVLPSLDPSRQTDKTNIWARSMHLLGRAVAFTARAIVWGVRAAVWFTTGLIKVVSAINNIIPVMAVLKGLLAVIVVSLIPLGIILAAVFVAFAVSAALALAPVLLISGAVVGLIALFSQLMTWIKSIATSILSELSPALNNLANNSLVRRFIGEAGENAPVPPPPSPTSNAGQNASTRIQRQQINFTDRTQGRPSANALSSHFAKLQLQETRRQTQELRRNTRTVNVHLNAAQLAESTRAANSDASEDSGSIVSQAD